MNTEIEDPCSPSTLVVQYFNSGKRHEVTPHQLIKLDQTQDGAVLTIESLCAGLTVLPVWWFTTEQPFQTVESVLLPPSLQKWQVLPRVWMPTHFSLWRLPLDSNLAWYHTSAFLGQGLYLETRNSFDRSAGLKISRARYRLALSEKLGAHARDVGFVELVEIALLSSVELFALHLGE